MAVTYTQHQGGGSTYSTDLTASGSINTKGGYVALVASLAADVDGFFLTISAVNNTARSFLVDIATGGAGSEVDLVSNVLLSVGGDVAGANMQFFVPIPIASGTRISARCQCTVASGTVSVSLLTVAGELAHLLTSAIAHTYGANTGTSRGTQVDPGGSANTKGTAVEFSAAISTTNNLKWLLVIPGNQQNAAMAAAKWAVDVVSGASLNVTEVPDLILTSNTVFDAVIPPVYCVPVDIANGTRIGLKAKCSTTDATDRLLDFVLIGIEGVSTIGPNRAAGQLANGGLAR